MYFKFENTLNLFCKFENTLNLFCKFKISLLKYNVEDLPVSLKFNLTNHNPTILTQPSRCLHHNQNACQITCTFKVFNSTASSALSCTLLASSLSPIFIKASTYLGVSGVCCSNSLIPF